MAKSGNTVPRYVGYVLAILGIVFVAKKAFDYGGQLNVVTLDAGVWLSSCTLAGLYGASETALAMAWRSMLSHFGVLVTRRWAIATYGISQLGKYIPGGIFHLLGRQSLGMSAGLSALNLAKSSLCEMATITMTAILFVILFLPVIFPYLAPSVSVLAFLIVLGGAVWLVSSGVGIELGRAICWHALFLTMSGLTFAGLLYVLDRQNNAFPTLVFPLCSAFVLAWLIGLLTPGVPAGLGVREMTLYGLLQSSVDTRHLLIAILISRAVTLGGDIIFFLFCLVSSTARHRNPLA